MPAIDSRLAGDINEAQRNAVQMNKNQSNTSRRCRECGSHYKLDAEEIDFYRKVGIKINSHRYEVPQPQQCPPCRRKHRRSFRNQTKLYMRECDQSGKRGISPYHPEKDYPVYHREVWWQKKRRGLEFGRHFDFSRTFFDQFHELLKMVPIESTRSVNCENSDYCNNVQDCKNSYMLLGASKCENCFYLDGCSTSSNSALAWKCKNLELCYHIFQSSNLFHCFYCELCFGCSDVRFSRLCFDCHHCFGCVNLSHKRYCIFNKQYSKEDYLQFMNSFNQGSLSHTERAWEKTKKFMRDVPTRGTVEWDNENCDGDMIFNSRHCSHAFTVEKCEHSKYIYDVKNAEYSFDLDNTSHCSGLCYQVVQSSQLFHTCFAINSHGCSDSFYIMDSYRLNHCFGCVGLYQEHYCLFNKRYRREDYYSLLEKVVAHMKETGEWGQMFPSSLSRFGYNESSAMSDHPMNKEECLKSGYLWSDYSRPSHQHEEPLNADQLPDNVLDVPDSICQQKIRCPETGTLFRIQKKELALYKMLNVPVQRVAFPRSLKNVRSARNKMQMQRRHCSNSVKDCNAEVNTTYADDVDQAIFCDDCHRHV